MHGKMLKNGRSDATRGLHAAGCSCCNTKGERKAPRKAVKKKERREWRREASL